MPQTLRIDAERPSEPDSTTAEKELLTRRDFAVNDEVLCQISSGADQLYLGVVVQVNHILKKCLVKFLDNTETWCIFKDMKFLNLVEQEVTCVICKTSHNIANNQLKVCSCGRGYHQLCHEPNIPVRDPSWRCRICSPTKRKECVDQIANSIGSNAIKPSEQLKLIGDEGKEYECHCGKKGAWYRGMLQCRRCRQWFHATCLRTLDHKVFWGDMFYIMICAGCNRGQELCVRLAMSWPELVHLVLYNLMLLHNKKYYDLDTAIMPYIHRHWPDLKLNPVMAVTSPSDRRKFVERSLLGNDKRFKCGKEVRKKNSLWGLRCGRAPRPPVITLPPRGVVDVSTLRTHVKKHLLMLDERPLQNGFVNSSRKDSLSSTTAAHSSRSASPDENRATDYKVGSSTTEYAGCGLVKRSVPFPLTEQTGNADARFRSQAVRRAARMLRRRKLQTLQNVVDFEDDTSSKEKSTTSKDLDTVEKILTLRDERTSKPEIRKRPQRNLLEARLNSTESKLYNPQAVTDDPKKKVAVPAEIPTKTKKLKKCDLKNKKTNKKLVQKTILETFQAGKWRVEAKLSDDMTQKTEVAGDSGSSADERSRTASVTPIKTVITKRQLSEKDIVVDRNGQVKRRRRHRKAIPGLSSQISIPSHRVLRPRDLPETVIKISPQELDVGPIDMDVVQELLGIPRRISLEDHCEVSAKRLRLDGKTEFLVEFPVPS